MATQKKKVIKEFSSGGLNSPMKMVKMIRALCKQCNPQGQGPRGWWETCPHDPYFSMQPAGPPKPVFEEMEDGTYKQVGTEEQRYEKRLNLEQVPDDAKVVSGRSVRIEQERGAKFPEELGYAPVCDYMNCWEPNPKIHAKQVIEHEGIQTEIGKYHSRDEAAIMVLRTSGTPIFLGLNQDMQRRQEQLNNTNVL